VTLTYIDDSALLARIKASDREAFRGLFERFQPVLFRNTLYRVKDSDLAHDIVQETFVRLWVHRARLKPHLPLLPYLFRINANLVRDYYKWAAVRLRHAEGLAGARRQAADDPGELMDARMLEEEISRIINTHMPARVRTVFLLSRVEGKTNPEIARMLGSSPKTVENQLGHALRILRRRLRHMSIPGI
jgi:RNA polymerase sigma-70 factor (ECF subfamily)